jgi:hypothetical protein
MKNRLLATAVIGSATLIGIGIDLKSASLVGSGVGVLLICMIVYLDGGK